MVVRGRSRTWKMEFIEMRALDEILKAARAKDNKTKILRFKAKPS